MPSQLTAERLREVLDYCPLTGIFTWKIDRVVGRGRVIRKKGDVAGWLHKASGYWLICIDDYDYRAHRLAFLWVNGEWPVRFVDHEDTVRHHNWWLNLRQATARLNQENQRKAKTSNKSSGLLGVSMDKRDGRYYAKITVDYRVVALGGYDNAEDAHQAYVSAKRKLHEGCTL